MTSRVASSSKSPARRVVMPALPRVPATTPPPSSPAVEQDPLASDLGALTVDGPPTISLTPAPTNSPLLPSADDDVFGNISAAASSEHVSSATNALAARIARRSQERSGYNGFVPRPDRVTQVPTAANAQGLYPPDALIFVANLSNQRTEEQLEVSCQQVFSVYGPCHIKIKSDRNRHPFAFVQYEHIEDANAAVDGSMSLHIDGRKIRVERAKAERAVILSKVGGGIVTEEEARALLQCFGPIELCAPTQNLDGPRANIYGAMYVKFAFYLDCQDALKTFQNHTSGFVLVIAPALEPRVRYGPTGSPVVRGFSTPRSIVDQKSIFVGNLPEGTTRQELQTLFEEFGTIIQVNVIRKVFGDDGINIFGFIEFGNAQEADHAANAERTLRGTRLRVEPKEYSARRPPRAYLPPTPTHDQTSHTQFGEPSYNAPPMNYGPEYYNAPAQMGAMAPHHAPGFIPHGPSMPPFHPYQHGQGFTTPPQTHIGRIGPMNVFSPSPSHHHPGNQYGHAMGPPHYAQPFGSSHYMGPIPEHNEEEY